ncbi:hypothetical protein R1flu_000381 [Riccia fluitans]|uniref:Uncharacterized protein n=1 Tax=Riccia fluitans TaxID=41844 RepID=A0ABD1Y0N0_9MARC
MRQWETEEILMANCPSSIPGAKTTTGLLRIWARARARLEISRSEFGESSAEVTINIGEQQGWFTTERAKAIKTTLRRHRIKTTGQWMDWAVGNDARRPLPWPEHIAVEVGLELFPTSTPVQLLPWNWKTKKKKGDWFSVTTKECRTLVGLPRRTAEALNRKWRRTEGIRQWRKRFQRISKSKLVTKEKLWLWKVLNLGMPMLDRMQKIGHGDGVYARCRSDIETPEHMWWQCRDTSDRWREFRYLTEELSCHIPRSDCFINMVDAAFRGLDMSKIVPFTLLTRAIWLDRNQMTYAQKRVHTPVAITIRFAAEMTKSLRGRFDPSTKVAKQLDSAEKTLLIAASRAGGREITTEKTTQGGEAGGIEAPGGERLETLSLNSSHGDDEEEDADSEVEGQ